MSLRARSERPRSGLESDEPARLEAANFIADMALDLRNIANRARLELLTQLLEMVFAEAMEASNGQASRQRSRRIER